MRACPGSHSNRNPANKITCLNLKKKRHLFGFKGEL